MLVFTQKNFFGVTYIFIYFAVKLTIFGFSYSVVRFSSITFSHKSRQAKRLSIKLLSRFYSPGQIFVSCLIEPSHFTAYVLAVK